MVVDRTNLTDEDIQMALAVKRVIRSKKKDAEVRQTKNGYKVMAINRDTEANIGCDDSPLSK